ncbi:hypothetical protein D1872_323840 [compost metagenome]
MAYYTLVNDKTGIEKLQVPFIPEGLDEGLNIELMGEVKNSRAYISKPKLSQ